MCGRLACSLSVEELPKYCAYRRCNSKSVEEPLWIGNSCYEFLPSFNVSPSGTVCVLADTRHFDVDLNTEYSLVPMRWGLIPIWSVDERKSQFHTHNAKIESITQSKIYKNEFVNGRRCVIVCEGFYEWQSTLKTETHQPYYFYFNHDPKIENVTETKPLVYLAGIFNAVKNADTSKVRYTCSIVTKDSNDYMVWCHPRMPIILSSFDDIERWISVSDEAPKDVLNFLKHYESGKNGPDNVFRYHPVDKQYVNNSKLNEKKCVERANFKRKSSSTLDCWVKKSKGNED